ncbi:hypothetical protein PYCCODRAFT_1439572 [Trametes coccinea BRFM310]|uniref:Uncharacterized protein n=1 Tax=Trametes coccinea (strain BRFM310) TaxID=1353009 RepID=A0A1Y2IAP8_TRAC3|nr:hypothetical protein PYCCODRAFT_1439572 [Trametes coccinea BRFM310]
MTRRSRSDACATSDGVDSKPNLFASVGGHPPDTTRVELPETCSLRGTAWQLQRCADQWSNQY